MVSLGMSLPTPDPSQFRLIGVDYGTEPIYSGADFSPDRKFRYTLWRIWGKQPVVNFLCLNPSTADEVKNDPTVERCERRARMWGYGGLLVTNIFALRSTDPKALYECEDPIGPENDAAILACAKQAGMVICAWGNHGKFMKRGQQVRKMLESNGIDLHYLKLSATTGEAYHPLYVAYHVQPKLWTRED
jgi:hypothetical protein